MGNRWLIRGVMLLGLVGGCGDDDEVIVDAAAGADGMVVAGPDAAAAVPDAAGGGADAMIGAPDAMAAAIDGGPAAAVEVVACAGVTPAATITTAGLAFSPAAVTIDAGDVLRFNPSGPHNMTAGAPGASTGEFETATNVETCLRFNVAGSYPFYCSVHPAMTGIVTVS